MEARCLAGSRALFRDLTGGLAAAPQTPAAFFQEKMLEMRQRHVKFEDTPYSLEPNVKESPGGLRDLHVVLWTARAAGFGLQLGRPGAPAGWPPRRKRAPCGAIERVLKRVRALLHIQSGRREDRLVFDLQAQVAAALGLGGRDARRASEELMQRYFRAAKQVTQLTTILLQNLERALFPQHDTGSRADRRRVPQQRRPARAARHGSCSSAIRRRSCGPS